MKKLIFTGLLGFSCLSYAQETLVMQYPEELYQYQDNGSLNGTARYRGLSGAMGALGGDLSATMANPASSAVFIGSEVGITAGLNMAKIDLERGNNYSDSQFDLQQAGGVMVFDELNSDDWQSIAVGINYQRSSEVNEIADITTNTIGTDGNELINYYSERYGNSSITNLNMAANYKHKLYIGGGINIHRSESNTYESIRVYDQLFDDNFRYIKDLTPNSRLSEGLSLNVGVIGKVNQNLRLGVAYQSPTWYKDTEEVVTLYTMFNGTDNQGSYYYIGREDELYLNDVTTSQKFTGSAALVLGAKGLISADYTYTDYSPAKYSPGGEFTLENSFISSNMKGTNTFKIGGELRHEDFRLRGGFRHEQSPFEEVNFELNDSSSVDYKPFGDLTGYSIGAGYEFEGFYLDAAYDFYKRDRNYLLAGNFYDYNGSVDAVGITEDEALNFLSLNAEDSGYAQVVKDVVEKQGNVTLTVGFRF